MPCSCGDIVCPCGIPCQCFESSCDCTNCSISVSRRCKLCHLPFGAENKVNICSCFLGESQISKAKLLCDEFQRKFENAIMDGLDESAYVFWMPVCRIQNSFEEVGNMTTVYESHMRPFDYAINSEVFFPNFNFFETPMYWPPSVICSGCNGGMPYLFSFGMPHFGGFTATEESEESWKNNFIWDSFHIAHTTINNEPSKHKHPSETAICGVKCSSELKAVDSCPSAQDNPAITSVEEACMNASMEKTANRNQVSSSNRHESKESPLSLRNSLENVAIEVKCSSDVVQENSKSISTERKHAKRTKFRNQQDKSDKITKVRREFKEGVLRSILDHTVKIPPNTPISKSAIQNNEFTKSEVTKDNNVSDDWFKYVQEWIQTLPQGSSSKIFGT